MSRSVFGPLAALVTAAGSASALIVNSSAPAFTLPDALGQPWKMADHLGRERLLVVSQPSAAYLDELTRQAELLRDRDLRVVALTLSGDPALKRSAGPTFTVLADPGGKVAARYGRAVLIGKDRSVKASYASLPSLTTVLGLIDTMPMRQQEQRTRGR